MYSTSDELNATVPCFLEIQWIGIPKHWNIAADVDFRSSDSAQSESVEQVSGMLDEVLNVIPSWMAPMRYFNVCFKIVM